MSFYKYIFVTKLEYVWARFYCTVLYASLLNNNRFQNGKHFVYLALISYINQKILMRRRHGLLDLFTRLRMRSFYHLLDFGEQESPRVLNQASTAAVVTLSTLWQGTLSWRTNQVRTMSERSLLTFFRVLRGSRTGYLGSFGNGHCWPGTSFQGHIGRTSSYRP